MNSIENDIINKYSIIALNNDEYFKNLKKKKKQMN